MRPKAARGRSAGGIPGKRGDVPQAERLKRRHAEHRLTADVAERVAALIAVRGRVGQLADADAVEDDDEDALEDRHQDGLRRRRAVG